MAMNYENRFKRFTLELLDLIERHIKEWGEAERGVFDIDAIMARVEAELDMPTEPTVYRKN